MKKTRKSIILMLAAFLTVLCLNIPVLAANTSDAGIAATPIQYTLSVGGKSVSMWAYSIEEEVFFKLRDIAMALNGTEKQFDISYQNDDDYKEVELIPGYAYTPVGGELSKPDNMEYAEARNTPYSLRCRGWVSILAYIVNGNHYIKLSDLTATMKFESSCDEKSRAAEINTSAETKSGGESVTGGETGDIIDNISLSCEGNSWYADENNNLIISYNSGETAVKTPVTFNNDEMEYVMAKEYPGVFVSKDKTIVAYGGINATPVYVICSDDMGKTWSEPELITQGVGISQMYVGFSTSDDGWLVFGDFHGMGYEDNFIYRTHDGGKTWTQIGNPNDLYARVLTGAGFANNQIGFLCYRYEFVDFEPAICRTLDGGYTWEKLYVTLPEEYKEYNKTPLSPVFYGTDGLFPIKLSNGDGDYATIYLSSTDYGKTWTYDEKYSLAHVGGDGQKPGRKGAI
jgi:hypothetical protein